MSSGPIEFMGERESPEVASTEYGGADGLIQPLRDDGAFVGSPESKGGHALTPGEAASAMMRAASVPLVGSEQTTGESLSGEAVVDPVSGREVPSELNATAGEVGNVAGQLSGLKPGGS